MRTHALALLSMLAVLALPLAVANEHGGDTDVNVNPPDDMDVNVEDNDQGGDAEESTFAGLSTTVVIILIVLAVLVVALIVAMASRP